MTRAALNLLFFLSAFSIIVPRFTLGESLGVGLDDILAIFLLPLFFLFLLFWRDKKYIIPFWGVVALFVFFVAIFFPLGTWSSTYRVGETRFSTELWQYLKRLSFFLLGFYFVLSDPDGERKSLKIIFYAFLFILLVGVVQLIGTPIGDYLAEIYGRRDAMVEKLVDRPFSIKRVFGVAGHPNAWGGLSVFIFAVTFPFCLSKAFIGRGSVLLFFIISSLALVNIVFSGSRGAVLALALVCVVIALWYMFSTEVMALEKIKVISVIFVILSAGLYAFADKILNLVFRFSVLIETAGGGRDNQIRDGFAVVRGSWEWFLGAGNTAQRTLGVGHGVEVEPVYVLINYGFLGFSMLAGILLVLLFSAYKLLFTKGLYAVPLAVAMISAIIGYVTFSMGYFFFQELVVGSSFWLFAGVFMACYQKYRTDEATLPVSIK